MRKGPLIELLLRMTGGPFLDGDLFPEGIEPTIDGLPDWLQAMVRRLLVLNGHGLVASSAFAGSFASTPAQMRAIAFVCGIESAAISWSARSKTTGPNRETIVPRGTQLLVAGADEG